MKILVVEDDTISRLFISRFLAEIGDCDQVINGNEALDAFVMAQNENEPYDLVCLDIMMPQMDGISVLKSIRQLERDHAEYGKSPVNIIMTTALGENELIKSAFDLGCNAYVTKPINLDNFKQVLSNLAIL